MRFEAEDRTIKNEQYENTTHAAKKAIDMEPDDADTSQQNDIYQRNTSTAGSEMDT